jgi:P27 family predicted phage terminase small subunit
VVPLLMASGLLSKIDRAILVTYCDAWADYVRLRAMADVQEPAARTTKGNLMVNPVWSQLNLAVSRLRDAAARFGMSPSDRVGLKSDRPGAGDPLAEFVGRRTSG